MFHAWWLSIPMYIILLYVVQAGDTIYVLYRDPCGAGG